jgi:hypothetical protein
MNRGNFFSELMRYPDGTYELLITEPLNEWIKRHSRA